MSGDRTHTYGMQDTYPDFYASGRKSWNANADVFRKGPPLSRFGRLIQPPMCEQDAQEKQENIANDVR